MCLRDDDTSYFTAPGELKYCYGDFWGVLPVTLATVPFIHGSAEKIWEVEKEEDRFKELRKWEEKATFEELTQYHLLEPIGLNKDLVEELKLFINMKLIEIAQHGVNHRYGEFGPEMQEKNVLFRGIRDGKEYLEKVFETEINIFIPPSNTIDTVCLDEVNRLNMQLFSCGSVICNNILDRAIKVLGRPRDTIDAVKNRILRTEWMPIRERMGYVIVGALTYDPEKDFAQFKKQVYDMLDKYGFVSICSHYKWLSNRNGYFDSKYREKYHCLLEDLYNKKNVKFVTGSEYFNLMQSKFFRNGKLV